MKYDYPACKTVDVTEDWFGTALPDPYAWLKDAKSPETLDFVARENAFTDAWFDKERVQAKIRQLKEERLPELYYSLTRFKDGYLAAKRREGKPYIQIVDKELKPVADFPKIPALEGYDVFSVSPNPADEDILCVQCQKFGAARPSVAVCRNESWELVSRMDGIFSYCWSKQDGCLYYSSTADDAGKQESVTSVYRFNPASGEITLIYEEPEYAIFGMVSASEDGAFVLAQVCKDYCLAKWVAIDTADDQVRTLTETDVEWEYMDTVDGLHYFITLSEAANGAVIAVDADGKRTMVLPESERILESGFACGGRLFAFAKQDVSSRLIDIRTGAEVALPSCMGALSYVGRGHGQVFLHFESFVDAPQLLSFDGQSMKTVLRASERSHPEILAEQHFAPSADGTPVPYYLVRRRDAKADGTAPALMYGYGGYNGGMPPWYQEMVTNVSIPVWVERGGIYVHCNLRGGNEYGPRWHEAGMRMQKRHCYEDFIGIAEQVIRDGWTAAGRIGITGCSNGGLLMSALVTMRPDLWGCVIDSVPHTDMIHFAEDDRGPMYVTEYGNPRESKEMFEYLLSYSPYHNVKEIAYPPVYVQTGERDNNVPPYHGKKFAARMQASNQSENPILLRVLAEGSHDRGSGEVFWRTIAEMQVFLEMALCKG